MPLIRWVYLLGAGHALQTRCSTDFIFVKAQGSGQDGQSELIASSAFALFSGLSTFGCS